MKRKDRYGMTVLLGKEYIQGDEVDKNRRDIYLEHDERSSLLIQSDISDSLVSILKSLIKQDLEEGLGEKRRLVFMSYTPRQEAIIELILNSAHKSNYSLIKLSEIPFYSLSLEEDILLDLPHYSKAVKVFEEKRVLVENFQGSNRIEDLGMDSPLVFSLNSDCVPGGITFAQESVLENLYFDVLDKIMRDSEQQFSFYYFLPSRKENENSKISIDSEHTLTTIIDEGKIIGSEDYSFYSSTLVLDERKKSTEWLPVGSLRSSTTKGPKFFQIIK